MDWFILGVSLVFVTWSLTLIFRKDEGTNARVRRIASFFGVALYGLASLLVVLLLPLSVFAKTSSGIYRMLSGLFSDLDPFGIFLGTLTISLLIISALIVLTILVDSAYLRYDGVRSEPTGNVYLPEWGTFFFGTYLSERWWRFPALVFALGSVWIVVVTPMGSGHWFISLLAALGGFISAIAIHEILQNIAEQPQHRLFPEIARWLKADALLEAGSGDERLKPKHYYAILSVALLLLLFVVDIVFPLERGSPAAAYLFILLTFAIWILGWLEFHFPTFKIPSVLFLAVAVVFVSTLLNKVLDKGYYTFDVYTQTFEPVYAPSLVSGENLVIVNVSGGGILSAAWSTYVLGRLLEERPELSGEIKLLSTVSGGSVGVAYYLTCLYQLGDCPKAGHEGAIETSLAEVAYALAYRDPWRSICLECSDRGRRLEARWMENGAHYFEDEAARSLKFSDLVPRIREGTLPGFVMNTTILETGERVMITPLTFTLDSDSDNVPKAETLSTFFTRKDGELDIDLWTAARLSATFPYISPAVRANFIPSNSHEQEVAEVKTCSDYIEPEHGGVTENNMKKRCKYHFLDGGYHDNFGVASSIDFLRSVLEEKYKDFREDEKGFRDDPGRLQRVLVIQIRLSNFDAKELPKAKSTLAAGLIGPLEGVMAVSGNGAVQRNRIALDNFINAWEKAFAGSIRFETMVIQPEKTLQGPLSWHLTETDIKELFEDPESTRFADNQINGAWGENNCWKLMNDFLEPEIIKDGTPNKKDGGVKGLPVNCGGRGNWGGHSSSSEQ